MIHPRFLEEVLSCEPHINILALTKELEQQEELTTGQVDLEEGGPPIRPGLLGGKRERQKHLINKCRDTGNNRGWGETKGRQEERGIT